MDAYRSLEVVTPPDTAAWLDDLKDFFKDQHIRYNEGDAEDQIILQQLGTAVEMFEDATSGRVVLSTTFAEHKPTWGVCSPLRLSRAKVTSVTSLSYYDTSDLLQTVDDGDYGTDLTGVPALLWMLGGESFPPLSPYRPRPVRVEYAAGWQPEQVPASVKTALFLMATNLYQYRGDEDVALPDGFDRLCRLWHTGNLPV